MLTLACCSFRFGARCSVCVMRPSSSSVNGTFAFRMSLPPVYGVVLWPLLPMRRCSWARDLFAKYVHTRMRTHAHHLGQPPFPKPKAQAKTNAGGKNFAQGWDSHKPAMSRYIFNPLGSEFPLDPVGSCERPHNPTKGSPHGSNTGEGLVIRVCFGTCIYPWKRILWHF